MDISDVDFDKLGLLNKVFSPTSPIKKKDFFIGRFDQITEILSSMTERGQHIILYGERGVGKTSLSNITKEIFDKHTVTSKITCSKDSTFNQLWDKAFKEIVQKFEITDNCIIYHQFKETAELDSRMIEQD
ncbi:P-loop NTPase fold protein [Leptospira santarosai]|uniref:P-loop NTPase fold protein n=1 Tax=Leptospira santarosai TaxID=28183 RepID=UPI000519AB37|nr:P-loop NTPase fold protein [Leptospira santarosai]